MLVFSRKFGRRAKAIRTILGDGAEIARATDLHRTRRGRTLLVELAGATDRVLLKRCRQPAGSLREVRNLVAINGVAGVNAPRFLGEWQNYFVEEFIAAEPVSRVLEGSDGERAARCRDAVVSHLAAIHAARDAVEKSVELRAAFVPDRVAARLRRCRDRIEGVGFPAYERRVGSVPAAWRRALSDAFLDRLTADVANTGESVLGHGEYHGDHLLFAPDDKVYTVDWGTLALASPWYDFAYPLLITPLAGRPALVELYLESMHGRGHLRGISRRRAEELATSGIAYHQVIAAQRVGNRLKSRGAAHWGERFRSSLDSLAGHAAFAPRSAGSR